MSFFMIEGRMLWIVGADLELFLDMGFAIRGFSGAGSRVGTVMGRRIFFGILLVRYAISVIVLTDCTTAGRTTAGRTRAGI